MKYLITSVLSAITLIGCSSTPQQPAAPAPTVSTVSEQRLVSNFTRNNVKVEWSCKWFTGITETTCVQGNIVSIEATGYAPSYGNSEALRETAFTVAHDVALDKLVRFIKQDLTSSRVTNTLAKNVEKAEDNLLSTGKQQSVSEDDTSLGVKSSRVNSNETARTVIESIRSQSSGIVRGARVIDEKVVDKQTVSVTVAWTVKYADESKSLSTYFSK